MRYGHFPQAQGLLYGTKPVMVAIVVQAIWRLGRMALRGWILLVAGGGCLCAALLGVAPIVILLTAGGAAALLAVSRKTQRPMAAGWLALPAGVTGTASATGLLPMLLVFLKLGVVVFGSGYVLLAFLQRDLVDRLHWVTQAQLIDAVTAGQITPGPVFATATFLGYLLHGYGGAAVATVGIFAPSFFMAGAVGALAGRIRKSRVAAAFLDGVNAAAVALMAAVALSLGRASLVDGWTWALAGISVVLLVRWEINATWLIVGGAAIGVLLHGMS
jgi:chromate transporter